MIVAPGHAVIIATDPIVDLPELAHDWFGLGTWAILGIIALLGFFGWMFYRQDRTFKGVEQVKEHVLNNHDTNLRDDIDKTHEEAAASKVEAAASKAVGEVVLSRVEDMLVQVAELRRDVGGLRGDFRIHQERHQYDVERLDRDIQNLAGNRPPRGTD